MKNRLLRILLSAVVFFVGIILFEILKFDILWLELTLYLAAFFVVGGDIVYNAFRNILRGSVFDENFLMTLATVGAFAIQEFPEAVAVMLFYQIGELFQSYAVDKSRKSIAKLMDIRPDYANVKVGETLIKKSPDEVKIGDIVVVSASERIPLDGKVIDGFSLVDTSALTGESVPREASIDSRVISGCINLTGVLTIEVEKVYAESTVSKILNLVENASEKKSKSENFITKFAKIYTPAVVVTAVLLAIVPPLVFQQSFLDWLYRALTFLVVSCPCALVVSIPMSFFGGLGGASRNGVLVKGGNYLEILAKTDTVVFDKTGTLTKGVFKVQEINAAGMTKQELLRYAAYVESYSNHPISKSLVEAYGKTINKDAVWEVNEIAGFGITAKVDGKVVAAGNIKLMQRLGIVFDKVVETGTVVYIAVDGSFVGSIIVADEIKEDSYTAISELKKAGIKSTVILTGDKELVGKKVGGQLGIDKVYCELLPEGKVEKLEELLGAKARRGKIAFVGDGINDAPVLSRADVGIAMGGLGSDAAIEAADVVVMTDEPSKIAVAKKIAKKTLNIALQNTVFAISIKVGVLVLSAFGIANMWMAIFADVGVTFLAVLNALRALFFKAGKSRGEAPAGMF